MGKGPRSWTAAALLVLPPLRESQDSRNASSTFASVLIRVVRLCVEVRMSNARASPSEKRRTVLVRPRRTGRAGRSVEASVWRRRGGSSSEEAVESDAEEEEKKRIEELEEGEERGDEPVPWHTLARSPKLVRREPRGERKRKEKSRSRRDVSRTERVDFTRLNCPTSGLAVVLKYMCPHQYMAVIQVILGLFDMKGLVGSIGDEAI
ncbi:hypothetical protein BJV78DRAFT_589497 [Lactifluus subvellereus]|nr:hypothetical protein BJV78DRAFT_589497 [Lactifluus subvellereus]